MRCPSIIVAFSKVMLFTEINPSIAEAVPKDGVSLNITSSAAPGPELPGVGLQFEGSFHLSEVSDVATVFCHVYVSALADIAVIAMAVEAKNAFFIL